MSWPWRRERGRHAGPVPSRPAEAEQPAPPVAVPAAAAKPVDEPDVRLGFDDGSEVQLSPGDPRAQALRHVADVLLHGGGS